jgi:pimeloyl-ACP methyl ester carboxylesterase
VRWLCFVGALLMLGQGHPADIASGVHLFYTDTGGSGAPVVFLHAATGSVRSWDHQTPAFAQAGYRVIAFDRRGWGRTTTGPGAALGTAADAGAGFHRETLTRQPATADDAEDAEVHV